MTELIKREEAIDAIEETDWYHINREGKLVHGATSDGEALYKAGDIYKALRNVPAADQAEDYERGRKEAWEIAQTAFGSTLTLYEAEDYVRILKGMQTDERR